MSVFPQFVQHIKDLGIYVEGYNYEAMYNIMVNNLTNNYIPQHQFIYTYAQVEDLYNLLDELLNPIQTDESNDVEIIETNDQNHQNHQNDMDDEDWTDEETTEPTNIINIIDPNQNMQYYYNIQYEAPAQLQSQAEQQLIHYLNNMNNIHNYNLNNVNNNLP